MVSRIKYVIITSFFLEDIMKQSNTGSFFYRMLCGAFLGISVIAPGISGSIMAVMMGIYDDLINIISNPFKNFKKNVTYLIPMGIGAVISMVLLLKALDFLFAHYPVPAYLLFMSLIAGGIPTVLDEVKKDVIKSRYFVGTLLAFVFALSIGLLAKSNFAIGIDTADVFSTGMRIYLPVCGAVAGMMSMVPGMSISMLLMMFSVYEPLLALANGILTPQTWFTEVWYDSVVIVCIFAVAFLVGMVLFSNVTKLVFKKYHTLGFLMVIGFMAGSVISIFPGIPQGLLTWVLTIVAVVIGLGISYLFKVLGQKFRA